MAKKKPIEEEEENFDDVNEDADDEPEEEEKFKCRVCNKMTTVDEGDDMILLCDNCSEKYNIDKIWDDFDAEKIPEEKLKSFDLTPYLLKPKAGKKK